MMSGIQLQNETKTNYFHRYTDENGFVGEIVLNVRDAMTFGEIKALPASGDKVTAVLDFIAILNEQYGAKASLSIAKELLEELPEGLLKSTNGSARYISKETAMEAIEKVRQKPHVIDQLKKFDTGAYRFLTKEDLQKRAAELSEFKILYSSFASPEKIKAGQYSEKAEEEKLNNPFVEHYAIEHNGQIIACVMHVMHGDKTYDADFVVHPSYRSEDVDPDTISIKEQKPHGLSQALCVKVYEDLVGTEAKIGRHPNIKGSWLIAGGYGALGVGARLYDKIFPAKTLQDNPQLQNEVGLFLLFGKRGPEFLKAANRQLTPDPELKFELVNEDESEYVKVALEQLSKSKEKNLAAKPTLSLSQAAETKKKEEAVVGISMFTELNKMPPVPKNPEIKSDIGYRN